MNDNEPTPGNEESIVFAFSVISAIMICMYLPFIISIIRGIIAYISDSNGKYREATRDHLKDKILYFPKILLLAFKSPTVLIEGFKVLISQPKLAIFFYLPKAFRVVFRPKIFILWLWAILFTSVMYSSLTFDAYKVLGLAHTASMSDIKKSYRALSKRYHPDQNKTEAARIIYHQVKKAYKALVKKDEFEDDLKNEDFSVGVAMPAFLINHQHDGLVLFTILGLLLAIPAFLYFKFRDKGNKIQQLVESIFAEREHISRFLDQLGVPKDRKRVENQLSRKYILIMLRELALVNPGVVERMLVGYPTFPEFILKCINPEKNRQFFAKQQVPEPIIAKMNQWAIENGEIAVIAYEKEINTIVGHEKDKDDSVEFLTQSVKVPNARYRATRYLLALHTDYLAKLINELLALIPGPIPSGKKILAAYDELFDLLPLVYEREPTVKNIQALSAIPRVLEEYYENIFPELDQLFKKFIQKYNEDQPGKRGSKKAMRSGSH